MSRIGNKPVPMIDGVKVAVDNGTFSAEGPKGKLSFDLRPEVKVEIQEDDKQIVVSRNNDERSSRAFLATNQYP